MRKIMKKLEHLLELGGVKKDITLLCISGVALILSLTGVVPLPFDIAWVAIILCGVPIILEAIIGLVTAFDLKADVLVSLALIASVCIGEDFAAGEVAFIMQFGALLEDLTVAKARAGIEKLVRLTPQTARVIVDGAEKVIPADRVQIGDRLRVLPGETVPVDGVILSGQTSVNQAVMTGESMPVDKGASDEVSSGTVNQFGAFEMKATRVGGGQLHSAHDPAGADGGRRKGENRRYGGPVGNLDRSDCADCRRPYLAYQRRDHPCRYHSCGVLSVRSGACHADGDHGGDRKRYQTRISRPDGRRSGASCQGKGRYV